MRRLAIALIFIPFATQATPIYVGPGERYIVSTETHDIQLDEGAMLIVRNGADTGSITAERGNTLIITGGKVGGILEYSSGWHTTIITGGEIGETYIDGSDLILTGGTFTEPFFMQDGEGEISGGHFVGAYGPDYSPCNQSGAVGLCFNGHMQITISGGLFDTGISLATPPNNIQNQFSYGIIFEGYGLDLSYLGILDDRDTYNITGILRDGTPIDTYVYGTHPNDGLQEFNSGTNKILLIEAPEPGSLALLALGLLGIGLASKDKVVSNKVAG